MRQEINRPVHSTDSAYKPGKLFTASLDQITSNQQMNVAYSRLRAIDGTRSKAKEGPRAGRRDMS